MIQNEVNSPEGEAIQNITIEQESTSWGTASMTLGIIGILLMLAPYIGIFLSITAVVFYNKQKKVGKINGVANTGLITGIIGIGLNAIMLIIVMIGLLAFSKFR